MRCYNPPRLDSPLGWLSRDHRKMLAVDGRSAFVTGPVRRRTWAGDPERGVEPWRDTGVEIRGPAVRRRRARLRPDLGRARRADAAGEASGRSRRRRATSRCASWPATPGPAGLYRLDLLVAALARERLWLTDAYFAGRPTYVQALRAAARDGVDVRLLVPGAAATSR